MDGIQVLRADLEGLMFADAALLRGLVSAALAGQRVDAARVRSLMVSLGMTLKDLNVMIGQLRVDPSTLDREASSPNPIAFALRFALR